MPLLEFESMELPLIFSCRELLDYEVFICSFGEEECLKSKAPPTHV
ncbi:hypothetical protein BX589_1028 [Paraburkholderia fungorum]|jgi:hypothetical protein|nr:hypothetical protein BX589_1028 [Paraburkholderia fungorum]